MLHMKIDDAGTHNLLDGAAEAEAFAKILGFTEAPPDIRADEVTQTHRLFRSRFQRDLVIGIRKDIAAECERFRLHYRLVHIGIVKVTPHRGTLWLTFEYNGLKVAVLVEHRINAWFSPWIRGERQLREHWWHKHDNISNRIIRRLLKRKGYDLVIAMGDPNCPPGVEAYDLLNETLNAHFDRIGVNRKIRASDVEGDKGGSDHHKVKVWF